MINPPKPLRLPLAVRARKPRQPKRPISKCLIGILHQPLLNLRRLRRGKDLIGSCFSAFEGRGQNGAQVRGFVHGRAVHPVGFVESVEGGDYG